jgi:hypothetical protein
VSRQSTSETFDIPVDHRVDVRPSFHQNNRAAADEPHAGPALRVHTSTYCADGTHAGCYAAKRRTESTQCEPDPPPNVPPQCVVGIDVAYPYVELHATSVDRNEQSLFTVCSTHRPVESLTVLMREKRSIL